MSTTRPRPSSTLPKPPTTLHPTAVIADSASLTGKHRITIGANSILHPRARITSTHGPVTIGKGCIISEKVVLGWQQDGTVTAGSEVVRGSGDFVVGAAGEDGGERGFGGVVLGDDVVLEPACSVQGSVGRGSCVEVGARVGRGARVGEVRVFVSHSSFLFFVGV